jgi:PAT family beta-lactamase induction signal transducer AmpG
MSIFRSRRMLVLFLLGFSSGLPLLLVGQTLQAWMTDAGVDLAHIAAIASAGLAYTFKFAWAPLLDRYQLPGLGRRRGWILLFQLGLILALLAMSAVDPLASPTALVIAAVAVTILSASQDIVIDAYTNDALAPEERAAGSAVSVMGYRIAMLTAGALALVLADHLVWRAIYAIMAGLMAIGLVGTYLAPEPALVEPPPRTLADAVIRPFTELYRRLGRRQLALILGFAATYKFGEQFAQVLLITFYKRVIHFTGAEIAVAIKFVGFGAWAVGGVLGGALVARYGLRKMLVAFGLFQASTHLAYLAIAYAGHNVPVLCVALFIENASAAMATAAFVAALMRVCNPAVSATQYALLTGLTSVGGRIFGPLAADVIDALGWKGFFVATIAMGVPGILLAWWANRDDDAPTRPPGTA